MCKLTDVLTYIFDTYSSKEYPISPLRLINILYLADWKAALSMGKTLSGIQWSIVDSKPKVDESTLSEIVESVERGGRKFGFSILGRIHRYSTNIPSRRERKALDFVLDFAKNQSDEALYLMVKSTYPTITQDESDIVDLTHLAHEYENVQPLLKA
jgi:hypothetical protein